MTLDQIRPAKGAIYRRRADGLGATVRGYLPSFSTAGLVRLELEDGREWTGTPEMFWLTWIHSDIYEPRLAAACS